MSLSSFSNSTRGLSPLLAYSTSHICVTSSPHRGIHPLRWDNIDPCPVIPDVSIALQDGDTLTFGKPVTANVIFIYDTEAVLSPLISQPVISLINSPTLPATPINCKGHAEEPPNAGCHSLFGLYSSPSSESSPSSSCEDFSQNDPVGEDDEDEEGDDHLDPLDEYLHIPFGGHAQTQSSTSAW